MKIIQKEGEEINKDFMILESNYVINDKHKFSDVIQVVNRVQFYIRSSLKGILRPYDRITFLN